MNQNLGHGLPALDVVCEPLAQPFGFMAQIFTVEVVRDCYGQKTSGLEIAAEPLGQPRHFQRIANGLFPLEEFL